MRFIWMGAVKDLLRLRRDPLSLLTWLAIPLILGGLLNMVFGDSASTPQGTLMVADEDASIASKALVDPFRGGQLAKMLKVEKVDRSVGRARLDRGEGSALLIIPRGMQIAYLAGKPVRLELFTNPSQRIIPMMIEQTLSTILDAFYMQRTSGSLRPPVPLIEVQASVVAERRQSFASLFFPSTMFMSVLFIANALAGDIWKERMFGTLRRAAATQLSLQRFLAGRLVFVAAVLLSIAAVAMLAAYRLLHVAAANLPVAGLWLIFSGTVLFLLLLLLVMHASSQRTANVMGNLVILPLGMLGGSFFPFEIMPAWMAAIGKLTPNGWALSQFKAILTGSSNLPDLATAFGVLAAVSIVAYVLVVRRLKRSFLV